MLAILLAGCSSSSSEGNGGNTADPTDTVSVTGVQTEVQTQATNEIWNTATTAPTEVPEQTEEKVNTVSAPAAAASPITGIELSYYDVEMDIDDQFMPIVTMYPEDAEDKSEIWTSSDTSVATVDDRGLITGVSGGYATITVASAVNSRVFACVSVHVVDYDEDYDDDRVHEIYLTDYNFTMDVGDTEMPYVSMYPSWADDFSEDWSSSDPSVAKVDGKGNITAVSPGYAVITVKSSDNPKVFASVSVRVRGDMNGAAAVSEEPSDGDFITVNEDDEPGAVKQINLTFYTATLETGGTTQPIVSMYPDDAYDKGEIWSSSDENVATVDEYGNITAVGVGDCIITVKSESNPDVEANVSVRVNASATEPTYIEGIIIANKTYALPADYAPDVDPEAQAAFDDMAAAAQAEGLNLFVVSGYRSYDYQSTLYDSYVAQYGQEAADRFSARPGHSEHQTGLAFDVNTIDDSFADTPEYEWLKEHCVEYGFIIRYPDGKESVTGYKFEPWHIRYLGKDTAKAVDDTGLTLEEYLGIGSEYADQ